MAISALGYYRSRKDNPIGNRSNKEVLIALLWDGAVYRSLFTTRLLIETIAILSDRVDHCTIIKYDDAALLSGRCTMRSVRVDRISWPHCEPPSTEDREDLERVVARGRSIRWSIRFDVSSRTDFSRRLIRCTKYKGASVTSQMPGVGCASYRRGHAFLFQDGWISKSARIVVPVSRFKRNRTRDRPPADLGRQPDLRVSSTSLDRCRDRDSTFQPPVESQGTRLGDLSRSIRCTSIDYSETE